MSDQLNPSVAPVVPLNLVAPPTAPSAAIDPAIAALIRNQSDELTRLREQNTQSAINAALSSAIAKHGHDLVEGTAGQVEALLRPLIRVAQAGGDQAIVGPDLSPIDAFVGGRLASKEFAHFRKASGVQGTASGNTQQGAPVGGQGHPFGGGVAPGQTAPAEKPKNLGMALLADAKAAMSAAGINPEAEPSRTPSMAFGLTRRDFPK